MVYAKKARIQPLPEKYLQCDPLPDPTNERDLTTFITLWREDQEKSLAEAAKNAQTSEDVIDAMQTIMGEAMANYDTKRQAWCDEYRAEMRRIELQKFDEITAYIMEYIETHTKLTKEQIAQIKDTNKARGKGDFTHKTFLEMVEHTKDLMFSIWGNVQGKSVMHKKLEHGPYAAMMPMNKTTMQIIFRCLWTSYDYLTPNKVQDDLVVGGIVDF